jgi:hypothetical protein
MIKWKEIFKPSLVRAEIEIEFLKQQNAQLNRKYDILVEKLGESKTVYRTGPLQPVKSEGLSKAPNSWGTYREDQKRKNQALEVTEVSNGV